MNIDRSFVPVEIVTFTVKNLLRESRDVVISYKASVLYQNLQLSS